MASARSSAILWVLLALAVIVSLFGIVNTLVLSTFERMRELGTLRAVGMNRRQVRRMVRHESVITALIGAVLGIAAGLGLAAVGVAMLGKYGLALRGPGDPAAGRGARGDPRGRARGGRSPPAAHPASTSSRRSRTSRPGSGGTASPGRGAGRRGAKPGRVAAKRRYAP